ncbi:metal-dependent hydrolase [Candidatus Dependentiae bacterium]|nr:metal-dependent hydrolase [Candidatus Dependentiae bacterium]
MPNYKGHLLGGAAFYILLLAGFSLYYYPLSTVVPWFLATLAGALFPDIDIKSKGQQFFYKLFFVAIALCALYKAFMLAIFLSLFAFLPLLCKHRGIFHNIWFLLLLVVGFSELLIFLAPTYRLIIIYNSFFFMLGIISHLWLDLGLKRMLRMK